MLTHGTVWYTWTMLVALLRFMAEVVEWAGFEDLAMRLYLLAIELESGPPMPEPGVVVFEDRELLAALAGHPGLNAEAPDDDN